MSRQPDIENERLKDKKKYQKSATNTYSNRKSRDKMIAAVCCPGPSLPGAWLGPGNYDEIWAVNTALHVIPEAHWLAAGDLPLFRGLLGPRRPQKGVLALADTVAEISRDPAWGHLVWLSWPSLSLHGAHAQRAPLTWSMQAALLHAYHRDFRRIDLYGADLSGTADCTGYTGEDRSEDRWQRERKDLAITVSLLTEHGVTVRRITHG